MKKDYSSILKLLAVLIFAVMPILFFGQTEEEEPADKPTNNRAYFSKYGYVGASLGGIAYHGDVYRTPVLPQ